MSPVGVTGGRKRGLLSIVRVPVRPESLRITEEGGNHVDGYVLGPYDEGDSLNITCVATGGETRHRLRPEFVRKGRFSGRPPPKVTWWYGDVLLDDSQERTGEREVRNVLHLEPLERKHASYIFTCQATNDEMFPPLSSSVLVDLNRKWPRGRFTVCPVVVVEATFIVAGLFRGGTYS